MTKAHTAGLCGMRSFTWIPGIAFGLLISCLILEGGAVRAAVIPTAAQVLAYRPRQPGVECTTPAADKVESCKVDWVRGTPKNGWTLTLKDSEGNLLRRFVDTNGDNRPDVWSYCKDGVEVYSEIDTTFTGKPDQYRWLNSGGAKWGVDENKDGRIDSWKAISPEEISQEILQALITKDVARLQALMLTEAELKAMGLPAEQADRIREQIKAAPEKFQDTVSKLSKLSAKAAWIHLETVAPQCVAVNGRADVIKHTRGTLLYDNGGASDWIQTGEMYQVGNAWRIVSGPTPGAAAPETSSGKGSQISGLDDNPELQKLIGELTELDKKAPASTPGVNATLAQHHLKRAELLERIVARVKPAERDPWIRQVADSLSTAVGASDPRDTAAMDRLVAVEKQLASGLAAGHTLTAYVTYREMQADYSRRLSDKEATRDFNKVQQAWLQRLAKFVQDFPKGEDTPDALLQAGMVSEFLDKGVEAKNWYAQLVRHFADKPQARKAEGSIRRLELEGKVLKLAGPMLNDPNVAFDIDQVRSKIAIVYYWASWNSQCTGDFAKMKKMLDDHKGKLALVCVNLDNTLEDARKYLGSSPAPGTHLHQDGGLEGKLATDFGIQVLPTIFLVGKDGKVISRNGQVANLEDEVKKLLK